MKSSGSIVALVIGAGLALGAGDVLTVPQAAARLEQLMPQVPSMLGAQFRVLAAEALKERHPDLAAKFVHAALEDVNGRESIDPELLSALTSVAPDETIALLPRLKVNADDVVIGALLQGDRVRQATTLYRASMQKGPIKFNAQLFKMLGNESPEEAKTLFVGYLAPFFVRRRHAATTFQPDQLRGSGCGLRA